MSDDDPVRAWLDDLGDSDDPADAIHLAMDHAPALLATPGVASALISDREGDAARRLLLFAALVEQARLNMEGRGRLAESFLAEARAAIDELADGGDLDLETAMTLARAYGSADIEAPDSLLSFLLADIQARAQDEGFPGDLDAGLDALQQEAGGDHYALYALLVDMLSAVPAPLRPGLVHHIADRDEAWCGRLALYWLLDTATEMRLAAAGGLRERARRGSLDPAAASPLPLIRTWIPADGARSLLDTALRAARRRELVGPLERLALRPVRLVGTLPDGSGGQSFAAALEDDDGPAAALVLLKTGQGVKDAFLVRGEDAEDALSLQIAEAGGFEVDWAVLEPALAAALAEGFSAGRPPAAGFIDVVSACGLGDLRPRTMTAHDWLAHIDPEREIAGLSAHRRGRLIGRSETWPDRHEMVAAWYEGTAVVDEALDRATGPRQLKAALWTCLEKRRGYWALLMLRTAHVLKAAGDADWRSFVATAAALLDGRSLKKVPIMDYILSASIAAWQVEEYGVAMAIPDDGVWPGGE